MKGTHVRILLNAVVAVLCVAALYSLHRSTPMSSDDYVYSFVYNAEHYVDPDFAERVSGPDDIWYSQVKHYMCWSGRFLAHSILQFFSISRTAWDIANTAVYSLVVLCFLFIATPRVKTALAIYPVAFIGLWLLMPQPGHIVMWQSGSCNYLWAALFVLAFLLMLFSRHKAANISALPFGLLAGNSNESLCVGLAFSIVIYTILHFRKTSLLFKAAVICLLIGTFSNIFSPGTTARLSTQTSGNLLSIPFRLYTGLVAAFSSTCLLIPSALTLIALVSLKRRHHQLSELINDQVVYLLIAALLSLGACIYSTEINSRSSFGFFLFSLLAVSLLHINKISALTDKKYNILLILMSAGMLLSYNFAKQDIELCFQNETRIIQKAINGESLISYEPTAERNSGRYCCASHLRPNCLALHNRAVAAYCNIGHPFSVVSRKEMDKIQNIPSDILEQAQPGHYLKIRPGYILTCLSKDVSACECAAYVTPSKPHSYLHTLRMRAKGWLLGGIDLISFPHEGRILCLIPGTDFDELHLDLYHGHRKETITLIPAEIPWFGE